MCFYDNRHPCAIKHLFIGLHFKYQSLRFICFPVMNSPVFPSLDNIYCTSSCFLNPHSREKYISGRMGGQMYGLTGVWTDGWLVVSVGVANLWQSTGLYGLLGLFRCVHQERISLGASVPPPARRGGVG